MGRASSSTDPYKGNVTHAVDLGKAVRAPESSEDYEDEPHDGRCFLEKPFGFKQQFIVHALTHERKQLPEGDWSLVFASDGFGCAVDSTGTSADIFLEDWLDKKLQHNDSDEGTVLYKNKACQTCRYSLAATMQGFVDMRATIFVGATYHEHQIQVCSVTWPRERRRFFWSMKDMYEHLALISYKREPSKWIWYCRGIGAVGETTFRNSYSLVVISRPPPQS